jgi:hypothetical protein
MKQIAQHKLIECLNERRRHVELLFFLSSARADNCNDRIRHAFLSCRFDTRCNSSTLPVGTVDSLVQHLTVVCLYEGRLIMSNESNGSSVSFVSEFTADSIRQAKFYSLSVLETCSVFCCLLLLYYLFFDRASRNTLHHHMFVALLLTSLCTCLVDIPLILFYLYQNRSPMQSNATCLLWNYVDLSLYALVSLLMLWASIERYLLIFYQNFTRTERRRLLFHYAPLMLIPVYVLVFYLAVVILHPCENHFDYSQVVCGELCYYSSTPVVGLVDQFLHNICPSILIAFLNVFLFVRVIWQKRYRMRQSVSWQRQRRLVLQLMPTVILYLCGVIPYGSVFCAYLLRFSSDASLYVQGQFFYLFYYVALFIPLLCLIALPKAYSRFFSRRPALVRPS